MWERLLSARILAAMLIALLVATTPTGARLRADLPVKLTDQEFWKLIEDFSEPNGFFRSDNLVSNEDTFQYVIPRLLEVVKPGGVYMGVGPDQNFTYIAALKPRMVFITDIRRGNLHMHLMYKALFELSADRTEFVSRLFSRSKPANIPANANGEMLFDAFALTDPSKARFDATLDAIFDVLERRHKFPLSAQDREGVHYIFEQFMQAGPFLAYASNGGGGRGGTRYPAFQDLQMADDGRGVQRAYLASDENYRYLRTLQQNNLVVPLVGNFGGTKAIRAVGNYVRQRGATVTTFYASNVEQYLFQDGIWGAFADNVATLPLDRTSMFIRSCFNNCSSAGGSRAVQLIDPILPLLQDFKAGRIRTYWDVVTHGR